MKCPNCNETLLMTERKGIEIDYCPSCRGVWLDKGELDKMLDYAAQRSGFDNPDPRNFDNGYLSHEPHPHGFSKPRRKKSFLGDLFDFD